MTGIRRSTALFLAAALMALAAILAHLGTEVRPRHLNAPLSTLPRILGQWRAVGPDGHLDQRTLDVLKPESYLLRSYVDPQGRSCALFIAFFGLQQEGQIIHSPRHCLPGSGWQITLRDEAAVPGPVGPWTVNHLTLTMGLDQLSVLYWYQGRGGVEADEYVDRLKLLVDGVLHQRSDGALVRLTMADNPADPGAPARQTELAARIIPALNRLLPSR